MCERVWRGVDTGDSGPTLQSLKMETLPNWLELMAAYTSDDASHIAFLAGDVLVEST